MELSDDNYFIEKIQMGEPEYFSRILDKYSKQVFALVVRIVDNREDAEELTQDIFMKVFHALSSFQGKSSFSTWLYKIAYNTAISATRKKQRMYATIDVNIPDDDVEINVSPEEILNKLNMAIKQLSVDESFLIMLYYMQNKPIEEIVQITGLTSSNVKTKLFRIRKKLFVLINKMENNEA